MRNGYLLSAFVFALIPMVCSQNPRVVRIEKEWTEMDFHPQIVGYFNGRIPAEVICDVQGLTTNVGYRILTYDVVYFDGKLTVEAHVVGNAIPDTICAIFQSFGSNSEIFFTNIKAMDLDGRITHLSPLKLIAVKED
ncbi:MAG: hypothetical protein P8O07_10550 [Crocinitomicaceae bacterium]|nr:hypothetical protein [Crocinitomicaceae bacterium]